MSLYTKIQNIKTQIIETERLLNMVIDHPIMSLSLKQKIAQLNEELNNLPKESYEPKVELLFSGNAVSGSEGIKINFLNKIIKPFQDLVKTQIAVTSFTNKVKRNVLKNKSTLYLTALPRGSFGIELAQLDKSDLMDDIEVSESIKQVIQIIEKTSLSDDEFEKIVETHPKSILKSLSKFFKAISDEESILKIQSNEVNAEIESDKVHLAYERVSKTINEETDEVIKGVFKGLLLESGKFEMITTNGIYISGFISSELDEDTLINYQKLYLNQEVEFLLTKNETHFKNGTLKISYELKEILNNAIS